VTDSHPASQPRCRSKYAQCISASRSKNVKVIAGEECVSQQRLLVGDVVISSAPRKNKRMHNAHTKGAESVEAEKAQECKTRICSVGNR